MNREFSPPPRATGVCCTHVGLSYITSLTWYVVCVRLLQATWPTNVCRHIHVGLCLSDFSSWIFNYCTHVLWGKESPGVQCTMLYNKVICRCWSQPKIRLNLNIWRNICKGFKLPGKRYLFNTTLSWVFNMYCNTFWYPISSYESVHFI